MLQNERDKLFSYEKKYLNIGVTKTGQPLHAIAIPWSGHSSAFNMRTPDIFLCEADLYDDEILLQLDKFTILGFYAFCGLEDYKVIGRFTHLQDIFLKDARNLQDLTFMENTPDWFMLFIQGAKLPNLNPLIPASGVSKRLHSYCLGLYDCHVDDISMLLDSNFHLYELLIWKNWNKEEHDRWQKVKSLIYHYYRLDAQRE